MVTSLVGAEADAVDRNVVLKAQTQWSNEYLEPERTKAPFMDVKAMNTTNKEANLKNLVRKDSDNLVVSQPKAKNRGEVPRTKANIIMAPDKGWPEEMAKTSIAWVTPQGIKIVKIPKRAGANTEGFFV